MELLKNICFGIGVAASLALLLIIVVFLLVGSAIVGPFTFAITVIVLAGGFAGVMTYLEGK